MDNPLTSPNDYSFFIHQLPDQYSAIQHSTLVYIPLGSKAGKVTGMVLFPDRVILCVLEFLNFELQVIEGYGYEVSRTRIALENLPPAEEYCRASYHDKEKLWWYDSFPHPHDPLLATTHPHHKHIHPDIKHNRIPAPNLTFTGPNLPFLVKEIISLNIR
ncbi:MAG: hypothetical protein GY795_45970 [Desulfobacterales bacterium]|nr:hypothetical protein [Desulfobacterales bacterium]